MDKIRVMLADDQRLFVQSLRTVIHSRTDDMTVVAIAHDGREALSMTRDAAPDVILMDVRMPVMDGVEATRAIHESFPAVKIVMLTTYDDDQYVRGAMKCGAVGYLLKNMPPGELIASIRVARTGTIQISPAVAGKVLRESARALLATDERADLPESLRPKVETLTPREREVLALITKAYDNMQIAETLHIADQTVKNHLHSIYEKLGVANRLQWIQLLKKARE